jgi:para-aminobenzoate synthetase component 1
MKLFRFPLPDMPIERLFTPFSAMAYSLFLDSAERAHRDSNYSFIAFLPIEMIESKNGKITITDSERQQIIHGCPFEEVEKRLQNYARLYQQHTNTEGFWGGAAGYFGYDLARQIEILPASAADNENVPDMAIGIYNQFCRFDHLKDQGEYCIYAYTHDDALQKYQNVMHMINAAPAPAFEIDTPIEWRSTHDRASYENDVKNIINYIEAGDIFQANLSQRFTAKAGVSFDPYAHYCHLRAVNAAPFGAYMNIGDIKIASCSPERFLQLENAEVETRPIKGTIARDNNPDIDLQNRRALCESEKERAENIMIVDLLRNDISRSCEDHSVTVPQLCALETFSKVHHLVSTITGRLRADQTALTLLQKAFPGGSITGAPKVRAMEIIENIETHRRGPYCGAIGYVSFNGTMDTNIAIRTLIYEGSMLHFNVGGGITAASNPAQEYEETMAKAAAIFESFEVQTTKRKQTKAHKT